MAMMSVFTGSLYRRAYGSSRSVCSKGRQPPGCIHRMNRVNSRNALRMMTAP